MTVVNVFVDVANMMKMIMRKMKKFFIIAIKQKENLIGVINSLLIQQQKLFSPI